MDFPLEEAYQDFARFAYTSPDRLVLRGYVPRLQHPAGFVTWARRLLPGQAITDSWLASLTRRFHKGMQRFATENGIAIIRSKKGMKKHEVAKEARARLKPASGVYLIMRSRELVKVYQSREPTQSKDPLHRNILMKKSFVDQYYLYLIDQYWGEISFKFSSHLPFNVTVFLNGNRWLAREATRSGISVSTNDNSVVRCSEPHKLQEISDSLDWRRIQSVCDHWAYRLLPALTQAERRASGFSYQWSVAQAEMSHNLVFKSSSRLTEILERHVDLNRRALHPHSLKTIFCGHLQGRYKDSDVSIRHAFGGLTVLKARYGRTILKQYNNHRQTLRTEACINHTPDIGVKKSLQNFDELRQRLLCLMADFQKAQTPVLATTVNRGELAALAKPGKVNDVPTAGIRLENERILAVLAALPQLVHAPEGFRSRDLRKVVEDALPIAYASPQAIYDLRKLRGKALVENVPGRRLYRPTREGLRIAAVLRKLKDSLLDPTLHTKRRKGRPQSQAKHPPDCFYQAIDEQLHQLCDFLGLRPAS